MFKRFKSFIEDPYWDSKQPLTPEKLNVASAALLLEVCTTDDSFALEEYRRLKNILIDCFGVERTDADQMISLASEKSTISSDKIRKFINSHCSYNDKFKLMKNMWTVAFSDGDLSQMEIDHISDVCRELGINEEDIVEAHQGSKRQIAF